MILFCRLSVPSRKRPYFGLLISPVCQSENSGQTERWMDGMNEAARAQGQDGEKVKLCLDDKVCWRRMHRLKPNSINMDFHSALPYAQRAENISDIIVFCPDGSHH